MDLTNARWRKSSYSGNQTNCVEIAPVLVPDRNWRKSTYSGNQTDCVEVAPSRAATGVRDSKNRAGGALLVPRPAWTRFLTALRTDTLAHD